MKKIFSTGYSENALSFAALLLRLSTGVLMLVSHGFNKLANFQKIAAHFADPFQIGRATSLSMVVFAEVFCMIFIILGLFTRIACIPIIISLTVALFYAHSGDLFGKGEMAALFLTCFIVLLCTGPGKISIDYLLSK